MIKMAQNPKLKQLNAFVENHGVQTAGLEMP